MFKSILKSLIKSYDKSIKDKKRNITRYENVLSGNLSDEKRSKIETRLAKDKETIKMWDERYKK